MHYKSKAVNREAKLIEVWYSGMVVTHESRMFELIVVRSSWGHLMYWAQSSL